MFELVATCAFGLESTVKYEIERLGFPAQITGPGRIRFSGDESTICQTNLWLRTADRVQIVVAEFAAPDFDALFETTKQLEWENWIPSNGRFPVIARTRKSQLTSVPALQRSVKKAIVERLKSKYQSDLSETESLYRIEIALLDDQAMLTLDTTGASLHKRGYRTLTGAAPIKETLAAALIQLSFWDGERPFVDPFCGTGTIPIEAALLGRNIAPGLKRDFAAETWPAVESSFWKAAREEAISAAVPKLPIRLIGTDTDPQSLKMARFHAEQAGVSDDIHFQEKGFERLTSKQQFGCVITNPPYGLRLGHDEKAKMEELYQSIPEVLRHLPTWSHFILTAYPRFESLIQKRADRRRKLYNGRIECTYFQFHGPKPGSKLDTTSHSSDTCQAQGFNVRKTSSAAPVFGGISDKGHEQAQLFASRLAKRARHLRKWPTKQDIHCFRLYERDIPEIPLVVDRIEDHLHIVEFERPHDRDLGQHADWLELMAKTAGETLKVDRRKVFLKRRARQRGLTQHERVDEANYEIEVREGGLRFWCNLSDYVDTGLFLDHRIARGMVRDAAKDKRVLNLFGYTGSFSVYAADGAASEVTTVDLSRTYLNWAIRNFELNGFRGSQYRFIQSDAKSFWESLSPESEFDVIVVDPPTFSNSKRTECDWEIQRDHVPMLNCLISHLSDNGTLFFSTNFRRFQLEEAELHSKSIREISRQTVPEDYRNRRIHRCWIIRR